MHRALLRTAAVLGSATLVLSAPATALAAGKGHAAPHAGKAKHVTKKPANKPVPAPFTAVGTIVGLDAEARTVTLSTTGGSSDLRGTTVVVTLVATTKVAVDGSPASLDLVDVGDAATANGSRVAGVLQAAHLNVTSAPVPPAPEEPAV